MKHPSSEIQSSSGIVTGVTNFLNSQSYNSSKPKAYINWILLDEQFNYYAGGFEQVGASGATTIHTRTNLSVTKSGYLYVYTSNEATNIPVYFDNLQVTHTRGALLEENSYYPFGLRQAGISSKALNFGDPKNKEKTFQGQRFDDELGLDWIQFKWRNHDPQIGRFIEIDPLAEDYEYNSTYAFSENKVTSHIELEGLEAVPLSSEIWQAAQQTSGAGAVGKAVVVGGAIVAGIVWLVEQVKESGIYMAPPVPGGLGIPGYDPIKGTYTPPTVVNSTPTKPQGSQNPKTKESAEVGQEAHRQIQKDLKKEGAKTEVPMTLKDGSNVRKDAVKPDGTPVIIKPDTKTGRASADKREKLLNKNEVKTPEKIFYNPNDPKYKPGSPTYIGPKKN